MVCFIAVILINGGYELFSFDVWSKNETYNQTMHSEIIDDILNGFDKYVESTNPGV